MYSKDIDILVVNNPQIICDVAKRFDLTLENAARHPSNCTEDWIQKDMERGVTYYALKNENIVAGVLH